MVELIGAELRDAARWKFFVVAGVIIFLPTVFGFLTADGYTLVDPLSYFSLMMRNLVPLTFPLLVVALYLPKVSDEFSNNFPTYARARVSISRYVATKMLSAAGIAFIVFFAMTFLTWAVAFLVEPAIGYLTYRPESMGLTTAQVAAQSHGRYTFAQLLTVSPVLYGLVYAVWVGLNAAIYAVLGVLALALIENRFIALAAPFLLYQLLDFILALSGLEEFGLSTSVFPFQIEQMPIWYAWVQYGGLLLICATAWALLTRRRFDVPGLS